ncbi:hypothetical protein NDU88_002441 [Pleurodeles waltl]|uniref:Uncharacterized protein n=1 Tax=Pleurodeles waltl TaxID=8319 RepID=A0AAV7VEK3_PLEWA|nr:hypothetical protein NDU88_002441 [Pleurodeles waltl]
MVARAAPREQEELLKDALSRTVKTLRVRRETVERLALRGNREPKIGGKRKKNKINTNDDFGDSAARLPLRWRFRFPTPHRIRLQRVNHHQEAAIQLHLLQV